MHPITNILTLKFWPAEKATLKQNMQQTAKFCTEMHEQKVQ